MKRSGMPQPNELVVIKITAIFPNSASAELVEYSGTGMIHVSEIAGRWVHDIREFVREHELGIARVLRVEGSQATLSIKKVRPEESSARLNEFKRESKAEKLLEQAAKANSIAEADLLAIASALRDSFGSLTKAFELAFKNPALFRERIPAKWAEPLIALAQKRFTEKTYELRGRLTLLSYKPDGLAAIKAALAPLEAAGLSVKYLSAPNYLVLGRGKNVKELEQRLLALAEAASKAPGIAEGKFELEKH